MRLLIYSHFFAPSVGGVETVVKSLATGLANLRTTGDAAVYEVTVVTHTPDLDTNTLSAPYRIIRRPSVDELRKVIASSDLIHVAGAAIPPIREALRIGKPVVVEHHGFQVICPTGQLLQEPQDAPCPGHFMKGNHAACLGCRKTGSFYGSFRLWLLTFFRRSLCKRVDVNIVPTAWLGERLKLPRTKTVAHGLPQESAITRTGSQDLKTIVFIGRLVTTKGVSLLREAARRLKEQARPFQLLLVGGGPERESLEERVRGWGLVPEVKFAGPVANEQLPRYLDQAAAVVVPSLGGEVFGMVVAESMLRGLPVVASDLGSFVEVLGNRDQTFRTGDAGGLARQLTRVLDNPNLAADWARDGRQRALSQFSEQKMIENHEEIYREVLQSRAKNRARG